MKNITDLKTVRLSDDQNAVVILDQTRLPAEECYLELTSAEDIWDAIYKLKVRGAPAIGVAAAYGIYVCSRQIEAGSFDEFYTAFRQVKEYLAGSRPTAVNLVAALNRMEKVVLENASETVPALVELLHKESLAIREEDAAACRRIGEHCLSLLRPGMGILTHCNAGHLAVSEYGTALAPVYLGEERGYGFKVFAEPGWMSRLFAIIWLRLLCRRVGYRRSLSVVTGSLPMAISLIRSGLRALPYLPGIMTFLFMFWDLLLRLICNVPMVNPLLLKSGILLK